MEIVVFGLPKIVVFWLCGLLTMLAVWCVWTAFVGLRTKDEHGRPVSVRWEARVSFWTGRFLLGMGVLAIFFMSSYGLMALILWMISQ